MTSHHYIFKDTRDRAEYERLRIIEELFDPLTKRLLSGIGLRPGMSILEAGPGAGGLLDWLSETAGESGTVTAIDLDTRFVEKILLPNLRIIQGDLTKMDLAREKFDMIHERYVLMHNPNFPEILDKMTAALKPGGWLLLEDADFSAARLDTPHPEISRGFYATKDAIKSLFSKKHNDYSFGGQLRGFLAQQGFMNIKEEAYAPLEQGGKGTAEIMRLSALQLRDQYLQTGAATESDLDLYVKIAGDPNQAAIYYSTVSAWGQKPVF